MTRPSSRLARLIRGGGRRALSDPISRCAALTATNMLFHDCPTPADRERQHADECEHGRPSALRGARDRRPVLDGVGDSEAAVFGRIEAQGGPLSRTCLRRRLLLSDSRSENHRVEELISVSSPSTVSE